jgi:hypothetical protein
MIQTLLVKAVAAASIPMATWHWQDKPADSAHFVEQQ